jgi:O-antigen ligase
MPDRFFERIENVFSGADATGAGRTEIWRVGMQALEQFGLFGAGLSNFPAAYSIYGHAFVAGHNAFLTTWVEVGIIGLAMLMALIVTHLRMVKPDNRYGPAVVLPATVEAAAFAFLIIGMFGDVVWHKVFWMIWILGVWAVRAQSVRSAT